MLAQAFGAENANWCTFATWASGTAGRFIRDEEVPRAFRLLLGRAEPFRVSFAHVNDALRRADANGFDGDSLLVVVLDVVRDVARLVAAGNLAVFGELGPIFARALDRLAADDSPDALESLAASLTPGESDAGGQGLLQSALRGYAAARGERDARRKAARMLLANAQVGLHEQIRLQPFIAGSIDAPVRDAVAEALEEVGAGLPRPIAGRLRTLVARHVEPAADAAARLWEELATRELMTLALPDGDLVLGRDLPAPRGGPLYPQVLDPIADPEAAAFLARYSADGETAAGTGVVDWARLANRMRYILELFRSRQCDAALQAAPFRDPPQ